MGSRVRRIARSIAPMPRPTPYHTTPADPTASIVDSASPIQSNWRASVVRR
jgi:hypothetical protein